MAIWDDIAKKAAALSDKAVKQARDLSEVAKLKMQIVEAEKTAEDTYTQLGRLYAAAPARRSARGGKSRSPSARTRRRRSRRPARRARRAAPCAGARPRARPRPR